MDSHGKESGNFLREVAGGENGSEYIVQKKSIFNKNRKEKKYASQNTSLPMHAWADVLVNLVSFRTFLKLSGFLLPEHINIPVEIECFTSS